MDLQDVELTAKKIFKHRTTYYIATVLGIASGKLQEALLLRQQQAIEEEEARKIIHENSATLILGAIILLDKINLPLDSILQEFSDIVAEQDEDEEEKPINIFDPLDDTLDESDQKGDV